MEQYKHDFTIAKNEEFDSCILIVQTKQLQFSKYKEPSFQKSQREAAAGNTLFTLAEK